MILSYIDVGDRIAVDPADGERGDVEGITDFASGGTVPNRSLDRSVSHGVPVIGEQLQSNDGQETRVTAE